ncbi:cytosolic phospholipase A2 zeta-like [Centroberyx affinis]|uniref:cytosolic phospholipase A2 zeta-like n=1 Tax=Centroberyx affinis TaxID=166261 RepID=UPI003A5C37F9
MEEGLGKLTKDDVSYWALSITILKALDIPSYDYGSESDCYVTLHLPTASAKTYQTTIVPNGGNPVWNETFNFRVPSHLKNVLELKLYDEDPLKSDNLISTLMFDISNLTPGKKENKVFTTNPETKGQLCVDFELQESEEPSHEYLTNGILVKDDVSYWALSITILKALDIPSYDYGSESDCYVTLHLPTASAKTYQTTIVPNSGNPVWDETFNFRVPSHLKNVLELKLYDEDPLKSDDLISPLMFDISNLTPGKKENKVFTTNPKKDDVSYWALSITILKALDIPSYDYGSESDCYVTLHLPTASAKTYQTTIVPNSGNPVWNETFNFRVPSHLKNVLELKLYDQDPRKSDDLISPLMFDISNLTPGKKENKVFTTNPKEARNLRFYVNRDLETELGVASSEEVPLLSAIKLQPLPANDNVKVSLPLGQDTVDLNLHTDDGMEEGLAVRMDFDIPPQEKEYLEKRKVVVGQALQKLLGLSSPPGPKKVPVIALVGSGGGTRAMTGLFGSLKGLQQIGVLDAATYITGVSGSTWTMTSLYQQANWSQQDLNSAISAMEGKITKDLLSSFSTDKLQYYKDEMDKKGEEGHTVSLVDMWGLVIEHLIFEKKTTSTLSEQQRAVADGQNPLPIYTAVNMKDELKGCEFEAEWCEFTPYEVGISKYGAFVPAEHVGSHFFLGHMIKKLIEPRIPFLMGIWSSAFSVNMIELWELATGAQPSWAVFQRSNINDIVSETATESGAAAGPSSVTEDVRQVSETATEREAAAGPSSSPDDVTEDVRQEVDNDPATLDTNLLNPAKRMANTVSDFLRNRPLIAQMYNFMRGLFLRWDYNKSSNFNAWKDTHPDAFPNKLTPADPTLRLVDAGHAINIGCAPVLRPEREADLIISLSYSWDPGHNLNVIQKTATYCKNHKIPFPNADFASLETEPDKEFYIFEDKENPKAPIVLHLPLVNVTYKKFKAPGVPRVGEAEIKAGVIDVSSSSSPYKTKNLILSQDDYRALVDLTTYNVLNNKESILEAVRKALERKASKMAS